MKRKIFLISLLVIALALVSVGSLAYFTAEDTAHNVITSGTVDILLEEWSKNGDTLVPFEDVVGVMPGTDVSKIVTVRNTGTADAWIRASVSIEVTVPLEDGTIATLDPKYVNLDYNTEDWTYIDGYWYCKIAPEANGVTAPLFTTVSFDIAMDNRYQNSTAVIDVNVQATQKANNGETVEDALGWPEAE